MSNEQHFTEDGTWRKPPGAVRLEVTLKGGDGEPAVQLSEGVGMGGRGGDPTFAEGFRAAAGGGGGGGASSHPVPGQLSKGGPGGVAVRTLDAGDVPDEVPVFVGRGGYAEIVTYLEGEA